MVNHKFLIVPICLLLIITSCTRESAESLYKSGEDLLSKGEVEKSLDNFLNVVELYPSNDLYDDTLLKIGELYYLNYSDFSNALKYFRQLLLAKNARIKLRFQAQSYIAEIYENSLKDYDQAIIEYQRLINNFENWISPDGGQFKIAKCYFKKGDYRQAIVEYEILSELFPASPLVEEAIYQTVTSNFILGDCPKAVKNYDRFRAKFPGSRLMPDIKFEIGSCYEEEGSLLESLNIFRELRNSYPNKKLLEMKINSVEKRLSLRKR